MVVSEHCCPLYPTIKINLALYEDVSNNDELKKRITEGKLNVGFLKPSMILDSFQVLTAATKAIHNREHSKMMTRNVHSEVLICLSATKNISDSFRKFGLDAADTSLLVVEIVAEGEESKMSEIHTLVKGNIVDINQLSRMADEQLIKKVYKIKDPELEVGSLLDSVVGRMASKDFVNY